MRITGQRCFSRWSAASHCVFELADVTGIPRCFGRRSRRTSCRARHPLRGRRSGPRAQVCLDHGGVQPALDQGGDGSDFGERVRNPRSNVRCGIRLTAWRFSAPYATDWLDVYLESVGLSARQNRSSSTTMAPQNRAGRYANTIQAHCRRLLGRPARDLTSRGHRALS